MTSKKMPNSVPEFHTQSGAVYKPGMRVNVHSRHGTKGTGVIVDILVWGNAPNTMVVEMDADTVYATEVESGWAPDEERIRTLGLFGGEIDSVITLN